MVRTSDEIDYAIHGADLQFVVIGLDPGETVIGEAGAMLYMEEGVTFESKMGDGSHPDQGFWGKLKGASKRVLSGESLFLTHFSNSGSAKTQIAFSAEFPGKIVPIDLSSCPGAIIAQRDAFLCAALGTTLDIAFQHRLGTGFFGGEGFILQRLSGDGVALLSVGGSVIEHNLEPGQVLRVDTGCLVAFDESVTYDIQRAGNLKSMVVGGEGLFLATMTGPGRVWLQSLPFDRLASRIAALVPSDG